MNKDINVTDILKMQDDLNIQTCGEFWRYGCKGTNKTDGKRTTFALATVQEVSELIDSINWKHWKDVNEKDNVENLKMEMIDIIHFIASLTMMSGTETYLMSHLKQGALVPTTKSELIDIALEFNVLMTPLVKLEANIEPSDKIDSSLDWILGDGGMWDNIYEGFTNLLFAVMDYCNIEPMDIFELYTAKSVLNLFRQNNGYREGTYSKLWYGEEDNVVLANIIKTLKETYKANEITIGMVYDKLENTYTEMYKRCNG